MLARVRSLTLLGIEAIPLTVECDLSRGLPGIHTVGLPDAAVRESADRVRAALRNSGFDVPPRKITISLAPADLRKEGAALDLPIALCILAAAGHLPQDRLSGMLVAGELGLDGSVRPIRGTLPALILAQKLGLREMLIPEANAVEALVTEGPSVYPVADLHQAVGVLRGERAPAPLTRSADPEGTASRGPDLEEIRGQAMARRALEIAAAGGHHLLMSGPPGCGKTMLARRLGGILPPLALPEALEVTCIYSAAGLTRGAGLMRTRPFRAPHHTISGVGLIGGGRGPRPGEMTLAHHGVLFLDELPLFGRATLDVLRQPLEDGRVFITRENRTLIMPARVMLIAAMNPCSCGQLGREDRPCRCTPAQVAQYRSRVSGPLLDRFDIQAEMQPLRSADLRDGAVSESSEKVARRVEEARQRQQARLQGARFNLNGQMTLADLRRHARPGPEGRRILDLALRRLGLSARAHDGILRVARTIADIDGADTITADQIAEAVQYRAFDRGAATETGGGV